MTRLLPLVLFLLLSTALAHTEVTVVSPTSTVPTAVSLRFSEPVNLRFASLRVLPMPAGKTADEVTKLALALKAESPELVNTGPRPSGMATKLSLPLKAKLSAGAYLIAWAVLSDDGHPVAGHHVFRVK